MTEPKESKQKEDKWPNRYLKPDSVWVVDTEWKHGVLSPLGSWFRSQEPEELARSMTYAFREGVLTGKYLAEIERSEKESK